MWYVGEIQQSTSKLEDTVHIDNNTGSKSISPCFVFTHVMYYVLQWEMGLPQGLETMVLFIEQKAMEIFPTKP